MIELTRRQVLGGLAAMCITNKASAHNENPNPLEMFKGIYAGLFKHSL